MIIEQIPDIALSMEANRLAKLYIASGGSASDEEDRMLSFFCEASIGSADYLDFVEAVSEMEDLER